MILGYKITKDIYYFYLKELEAIESASESIRLSAKYANAWYKKYCILFS